MPKKRLSRNAKRADRWIQVLLLAHFIAGGVVAQAVCLEPTAKVCAEYAHRDLIAVVTAVSKREVPDAQDPGEVMGTMFHVRVERVLKGPAIKVDDIFTENASDRYPLEIGVRYLIFASFNANLNTWEVTNCSLSRPFAEAAQTMKEIERVKTAKDGVIEGRVVKRSTWKGIAGVSVLVVSQIPPGMKSLATTDRGGWFHLKVPPGDYVASVDRAGVRPFDLSYDDPNGFRVPVGGCGLLQFVEENE
ncbi:MAG TPA: carboxypeptidase-like regulatory domain-containing protein [Candidatus Polarisedimenticolaceae bacterium]|nr:carboxypeptidase-like regulatory domain-containing protein [Candidatus Polarisedimenticolaceae bacterium]